MFKFYSSSKIALEIVKTAIFRNYPFIKSGHKNILIFISPDNSFLDLIKESILNNKKIIILGSLSIEIASLLKLEIDSFTAYSYTKNMLCLDQEEEYNHSDYYVNYNNEKRFFTRFDFMDEWNNHGYGRISTQKDIWSVSQVIKNKGAKSLAQVYDENGFVSEFVTLTDFEKSSILYINREVGLVDGLDWNIVEDFLVKYRQDELPGVPLILDVPCGYKTVVSPRLDCDQSIINTKPLVELYKSYNIDLSLAIATGIDISKEEIIYLNDYYDNGGALLSHTVNHYFNWGDCYETVLDEANGSKIWLERNVKNLIELKYAVCPFHTNKPYSIEALADAGYKGFISGIIHNDPEYLLGVSGQVPFTRKDIVSHSQQCMLHGDCFHRYNNTIKAYKESFESHYKAKKMFGYLDHPFGDYDYGWQSEAERLEAHKEFIEYINTFNDVKWMTSTEILDFVVDKSSLKIEINSNDELICQRVQFNSNEKIKVLYKDKEYIC